MAQIPVSVVHCSDELVMNLALLSVAVYSLAVVALVTAGGEWSVVVVVVVAHVVQWEVKGYQS